MQNISVKTKFNELKITKLNYCKNLLKNKNNRGKTVNFLNNYKQSSLRNFRTKNLCFFLCELRLRSCSLICIFNFTFFVLQIEPFFFTIRWLLYWVIYTKTHYTYKTSTYMTQTFLLAWYQLILRTEDF